MPVLVVEIRVMAVTVAQRSVNVHMAMAGSRRYREIMAVLMVAVIVAVPVIML